ncbi:3-deoxy-D-manno-octulosonate 8-phosphate phosphatase [Pokkaliibacter plantistimulans]|uniref:3-deoxy-D-manno-octulosonate 8-phosphate phosphatase KdsC n=1 Tax=Pokkaliibacter plantistimulans TaxID=1635171 RepID=A0ABX5LYI4_9GAMM|nr:3-deoxy-manno-octulosonate-8-phosphatase KdsC [Pokkaliibacter plantistimulans]PXF31729.1 3-deoxy-D-manno-octulosonate 8-phosphate phosphatase [Pokkaliibacter plantistimulans]
MTQESTLDSLLLQRAQRITMLIMDVDGVLTDGRLYFAEEGYELKAFNSLDGHGIKMLHKAGIKTAIITGRRSALVAKRAKDLGIHFLFQGREDKLDALEELRQEHQIDMENIAYIGDDWPDLPVLRRVGLAVTVPNAAPALQPHTHYCCQRNGGEGAVRELCELILTAQQKLSDCLQPYLD